VVVDAGLGESDLEQRAPLGVVGRVQREHEWDVLVDEDVGERGRERSCRSRCRFSGDGEGAARRSRGQSRGREQWAGGGGRQCTGETGAR
jgi:hypothetical protein